MKVNGKKRREQVMKKNRFKFLEWDWSSGSIEKVVECELDSIRLFVFEKTMKVLDSVEGEIKVQFNDLFEHLVKMDEWCYYIDAITLDNRNSVVRIDGDAKINLNNYSVSSENISSESFVEFLHMSFADEVCKDDAMKIMKYFIDKAYDGVEEVPPCKLEFVEKKKGASDD